nr:MAG TPA: hypothetical protein [Caudoviricetes sp.]
MFCNNCRKQMFVCQDKKYNICTFHFKTNKILCIL